MSSPLLQLERISKEFTGVKALMDISLSVYSGEIHAIVGENGAGKSTLVNILAGQLRPTSGRILLNGQEMIFRAPADSLRAGIAVVYQEPTLCPNLSVCANIFLGRENRAVLGKPNWRNMDASARCILRRLGLQIDPNVLVSRLPLAYQQLVELARALQFSARLIILDEVTASLTPKEVSSLFQIMRELKENGVSFLFISHKIREVIEISDRVTVLRDGRLVATCPTAATDPGQLITLMLGETLIERPRRHVAASAPILLRAIDLAGPGFARVNLLIRRGEIVGLAGLPGSGRELVLRALYGLVPVHAGRILWQDTPLRIHSPKDAIRHGIGFVSSDRRGEASFLNLSVAHNIITVKPPTDMIPGIISRKRMHQTALQLIDHLKIKCASTQQLMATLSGGNQQKAIFARWMHVKPELLILDDPTRGVDVRARRDIHDLLSKMANSGVAILLSSTDPRELCLLCDRIYAMYRGSIIAHLEGEQIHESNVVSAIQGLTLN